MMNNWLTPDKLADHAVNLFDPPISLHHRSKAYSPLVFAFPHSGRNYPDAFLAQTCLQLSDLRRSEDAFVDLLFPKSALDQANFITALFPRSWLDANRHPQALDPEMFNEKIPGLIQQISAQVQAGFGVIPKLAALDYPIYSHKLHISEIAQRLQNTHIPYHRELKGALRRAKAKFGFAILIDCHSMPSTSTRQTPDGQIDVVLGDRHGSSCDSKITDIMEKVFCDLGLRVKRNQPYAGGYSVLQHGQAKMGIHAIQIELSRNLYIDETTLEKNAGFEPLLQKTKHFMQEMNAFAATFSILASQ